MKVKYYLIMIFLNISTSFFAQISDYSQAKSILLNLNDDNLIEPSKKVLQYLDLNLLEAEDQIDEQNGLPPRFGFPKDVDYNLQNSGVWKVLSNGDRIWRLKIICRDALSINLLYDYFWLPQGAKLHIYSEDKNQIKGGFTSDNNRGTQQNPSKFTTGLIFGDAIVLELFEPSSVKDASILSIDKVVQGYKRINVLNHVYNEYAQQNFGDSGPCQVNINCLEGQNWQDEKKGIALILVNGSRICTGSLVTNTSEDLTPYFLTADHCIGTLDANGNTDASHYSFYWNYESNTCSNTTDITPPSTSGATLLANNTNSDFALFVLTESPVDNNIDVYFNGWDRTTSPTMGGVGIHHPRGDFKKIATHNMIPINGQIFNPNTHWRVNWIATANGYSVTEGGSSGSPLFTNNKRLIGQLHGGSFINCSDPANDPGEYGKFHISWNDSSPQRRLRDWLDPLNTNQIFIDGTYGCEVISDIIINGPDLLPYGQQATYSTNYGSVGNIEWSAVGLDIINIDGYGNAIVQSTGTGTGYLTATNYCMETTKQIIIYQQEHIVPYPNSADNFFNLDFSSYPPNTLFSIYIYDQYQNTFYSGESTNIVKTISTLDFPSGSYFLHIYINGELTAKQIFVQH